MATKKKSTTRPKSALTLPEAEENFNQAIFQLFVNYHLKDIKVQLWNWLTVALSKDHSFLDSGKERSNLIFFYENLVEVFEATWIMNQKLNKDGPDAV